MPGDLRWTDDHCHLPDDGTAGDLLAAARAAGVERVVHVGTDVASSRAAMALAAAHDGVWATAGVHSSRRHSPTSQRLKSFMYGSSASLGTGSGGPAGTCTTATPSRICTWPGSVAQSRRV